MVTAKAKSKIKDSLKEEKRKIADEWKYIVQRKLENFGAAYNQHNIDVLTAFYKLNSSLDFFYQVSVRNIDLKELKEFQLLGDRLEPPRPIKPALTEIKSNDPATQAVPRKDTELIILEQDVAEGSMQGVLPWKLPAGGVAVNSSLPRAADGC